MCISWDIFTVSVMAWDGRSHIYAYAKHAPLTPYMLCGSRVGLMPGGGCVRRKLMCYFVGMCVLMWLGRMLVVILNNLSYDYIDLCSGWVVRILYRVNAISDCYLYININVFYTTPTIYTYSFRRTMHLNNLSLTQIFNLTFINNNNKDFFYLIFFTL